MVAVIVVMFGLFARGKGAAGGGDGGDAGIKSDAISSPAQFAQRLLRWQLLRRAAAKPVGPHGQPRQGGSCALMQYSLSI